MTANGKTLLTKTLIGVIITLILIGAFSCEDTARFSAFEGLWTEATGKKGVYTLEITRAGKDYTFIYLRADGSEVARVEGGRVHKDRLLVGNELFVYSYQIREDTLIISADVTDKIEKFVRLR